MRIILYIMLICTTNYALCQNKVGMVITSEKHIPISYANISIENSPSGTYTNEKGYFSLNCNNSDYINISAIGYKSQKCKCSSVSDTLILIEDPLMLDDVVVVSNKRRDMRKAYDIGYHREKHDGSFTGINAFSVFINNSDHLIASVQSVVIKLSRIKWIYDNPKPQFYELLLRVKFFKGDNVTGPQELLTNNSFLKKVGRKDDKIEIDLEHNEIPFQGKGVFVGVEFLGYYIDDNFISFSSDDSQKAVQYKVSFSESNEAPYSWVRKDYNKRWEKITSSPNPYLNFNVGLKVRSLQ